MIASWVVASKGLGFFLPSVFPNCCFQVAGMLLSGVLDCSLLGRSRQGAAVQWRLYRCRQRASASQRTEGQLHARPNVRPFWWSAHPHPKSALLPTPPKGDRFPVAWKWLLPRTKRAGAAPPLHSFIESSSGGVQFLFLHIFICSHDFFLLECVLDLFPSFCCFRHVFLVLVFSEDVLQECRFVGFFHCLSTSQQTCCFRHSVRFCVRCSIVVPKTLSYVQIRRTSAPLHI